MARGGAAEDLFSGAKRLCSYRRAASAVCFVNLIAVLYVLGALYASHQDVLPPLSPSSDDQIRRAEESIRLRKAYEPVELVRLVKEIKQGLSREGRQWKLSKHVQHVLTDEILERFKVLKSDSDINEQREVVEIWRSEKLEAIKKVVRMNSTSNSSISMEEAKMLEKALEYDWLALSEHLGLWMPANITSNENIDDPEIDIIPGRPMPPECHAELHTDYDGSAVRWGLTHHKESAADCCEACLDQARSAKPGEMKCNIWVYCPSESGCYSPDIYQHKHQECWLKQADVPRLNFKDRYEDWYRSSHPNAPVVVPWTSGIVKT